MTLKRVDRKASCLQSEMMSEDIADKVDRKPLPPAAKRALAEAAERRAAYEKKAEELARQAETNGRGGLDPVRYDDWEVKGIASDFS
jgi:hypothetical protein